MKSLIQSMCAQVASAAEEESQVAEGINQDLATIRGLAHSTSVATEQINSSSQELVHHAEQLRAVVRQSRI